MKTFMSLWWILKDMTSVSARHLILIFSETDTILNMKGKFYKTLALNKAVEHIPSEHDLLFLFDLHIDVPADIMDSVRKVRLKIHFNLSHSSEPKIVFAQC